MNSRWVPAQAPCAEVFFNRFIERLRQGWDRWYGPAYPDKTAWTRIMKDLLKELAIKDFEYRDADECPEKNRCVTHEYYRVDQCWFAYAPCHMGGDVTWRLDVAVEHENEENLYRYEVRKLLHIRCPLRVVVGYPRVEGGLDCPFGPNNEARKLLDEWLDLSKARDTQDGEFILILGHRTPWGDENRLWRAYDLLSSSRWEPREERL